MFKNSKILMVFAFFAALCSACGGSSSPSPSAVEKNNVIEKRANLNAGHITISENTASGSQLAVFPFAVDIDEVDEVSYAIVGEGNEYFTIDEETAEISLRVPLDFEHKEKHVLELVASSTDGTSISSDFIISVEDYPVINTYFPATHGVVTEDTVSIFGKVDSNHPDSLSLDAVIGSERYVSTINGKGEFQILDVPVGASLTSISLQVAEGEETGLAELSIKKVAAPMGESVGTGSKFGTLLDIALHKKRKKLYVADFTFRSIIEVDIATGNREVIYNNPRSTVMALTLDESNNRLIISEGNGLHYLDLDTREIQQLPDCTEIERAIAITAEDLEIINNQLYVLSNNAIVEVELTTGTCNYLSQETDSITNELAYDSVRQLIYMINPGSSSDKSLDRIDAVEIDTGVLFPFSYAARLEYNGYMSPGIIFYHKKTDSVYAIPHRWQYIVRIPAHNGTQSKASDFLLNIPGFKESPNFNMQAAVVDSEKNRVFLAYAGGVILLNLENFEFEFISQ